MKKLIAALLASGILLSGCGDPASKERYHRECRDAGGEVTVIGTQASCLKDGAVIAEWVEYKS